MKQFRRWSDFLENRLSPIDSEEYPNREREGLEGPFRYKNGKIFYYDTKEGKYYDSKTDLYVDISELE